jgi:hypothetical protein
MQMDIDRTASRTSITLWRYYCSPELLRDAVTALPGYDPAHEQGHVKFAHTATLPDHSLLIRDYLMPNGPEEHVRYVYLVNLFHVAETVIAICCRRELAWAIRNDHFSHCKLGTVELDIEALAKAHADAVRKLHFRLENNPSLTEVTLGGPDVMRSELFRTIGVATYHSAVLSGAFGLVENSEMYCGRSGILAIEPSLAHREIQRISKEVLQYERRHRQI